MLQTRDPLLRRTEKALRSRVPPKLQPGLEKAVLAGLGIMYSKNGATYLREQLTQPGRVPDVVGDGAAKLVGLLIQQSRNTMPTAIASVAASLFALEGLDVLRKTRQLEITNELIAQTIQETGAAFLQLYGVTPEKLQQMAAEKQGAAAQPAGIIGGAATAQPATTEAA